MVRVRAIHARIDATGADPESDPHASTPTDLVTIQVTIDADAKPGTYPFRVVTKQGVSNAIVRQNHEKGRAAKCFEPAPQNPTTAAVSLDTPISRS